MTGDEAVALIQDYRRNEYRHRGSVLCIKQDTHLKKCALGRYLCTELIRAIRASRENPIHVVHDIYRMLDDVLSESDDDQFEVHEFAARMELEAADILSFLKAKEREKYEDRE